MSHLTVWCSILVFETVHRTAGQCIKRTIIRKYSRLGMQKLKWQVSNLSQSYKATYNLWKKIFRADLFPSYCGSLSISVTRKDVYRSFLRFKVVTCNLGDNTLLCKPITENLHMVQPYNQYATVRSFVTINPLNDLLWVRYRFLRCQSVLFVSKTVQCPWIANSPWFRAQ